MNIWVEKTFQYWSSGGPLLIPMVLISFGIGACFFRSRERLERMIGDGRQLETELSHCANMAEAAAIAETHAQKCGGIGAMLGLAIQDATSGTPPMEAMQARVDEGLNLLRRDFVVLAALTGVSPLLGLLGTVMGMVDTFDAVSIVSGDTGSRVAAGISRSLITTQFGLVVALPGVFGMAQLQRMVSYTEVLMADCRAHVVNLLEHTMEKNQA
ncbi:MAG: MotA/TolQ/ExbB proton channel family protein [Verrucomicrobia bacterium]|nr:MotA/TolQ/ExbB proton channel family protein [Verrucomicrobiota bacterium]